MKIGELAEAASTQVETIRYDERAGLLPAAPRSDANYRIYGPQHVERLTFIRRGRSLDKRAAARAARTCEGCPPAAFAAPLKTRRVTVVGRAGLEPATERL